MKKRKILDWITMTGHDVNSAIDYVPDGIEIAEALHPVKHYPVRWGLNPGGTLSVGGDDRQGFMVQFTGGDCVKIRGDGMSVYDLMLQMARNGLKATRIDYAVDIFEGVNPDDIYKHWVRGMVQTSIRTKPHRYHEDGKGDYTCYFGSRNSDKFIRVYNKAAEMKLLNDAWVRVEYQTRKKIAEAFRKDLEYDGLTNAGDAAIKRLMDVKACLWWSEAIDGEAGYHTEVPRKDEDWKKWLMTQVLPAIEKRSRESGVSRDWLKDWLVTAVRVVYADSESDE